MLSVDTSDVTARIAQMKELAADLLQLAIGAPEHAEMLFRLSEEAEVEAENLREQIVRM